MDLPEPLSPEKLYREVDPQELPFETTAGLEDGKEIVGQQRAIEAIKFGIGVQHQGYNLFALGPNGVGRSTAINRYLERRAAEEPTPDDWCYVYNFKQPYKPTALRLPTGRAGAFRADMARLVEELGSVLPSAFSSDEYQLQRRTLEEEMRGQQAEALEKLRDQARERSIALIQTPNGFAFAPLNAEGEVISPDDFMKMEQDAQKHIEDEVNSLQEDLQKIMRQMPGWQRAMQTQLRELNERIARFAVDPLFKELSEKYSDLPAVVDYLEDARKDVVENFQAFMEDEEDSPGRQLGVALGIASSARKSATTRYEVNVVVDNSDTKGAPIVFVDQPRYQALVGRVEHIAQMGALMTDFTLIKPGALHEANGGYLVVDAAKLLTEPFAWEALKRALRKSEIVIESLGQVYSAISTVSLEPEPIPLDVKVVLIGERQLYYLLNAYDPEFSELFKISADFNDEMERDPANTLAYARLLAGIAQREKLRPLDRAAVARVIEYASRLVGDQDKLSTHVQTTGDLLREADYIASQNSHDVIQRADVQEALDLQRYRADRIHERIQESIVRNQVLIDTQGAVVGQVNGLSVYTLGNQSFGRPSRITARVRMGKGEVIDIERQVEMGGPIHSKGVLILSGLLGQRYAADRPLSLSATLVFEQSYGGIEGDSASSAELYALLSALSQVPIKQSMAVTGSVNQRGQIQAIGGVNEKIEGFFDICKARGLTGEQGVLIPQSNVENLMLRQDVIDAVAAGKFAIYPVTTIDEGITLLTGVPAGEPDESGDYPPDTVNGRVVARLMHFTDRLREFGAQPESQRLEPKPEPEPAVDGSKRDDGA